MKKAVLIISLSLIFQNISAQIETIIWQQCLGTESLSNMVYAVEKTTSGYMFGIGLGADGPGVSNYHGGGDTWVVNTDNHGNILWERCYGGSDGDRPEKIIKINDSFYYLLNWSISIDGDVQNGRPGNFWIVKINDVGDILWESSYGGSVGGEEVRDALLMPDDGLLMMGRIYSTGGDVSTHYGSMDVWLCRIDSTGNILWEKTFGNQGRDNAIKIKLTADQTVLMIGCHYEPGGMIDCPIIQEYGPDVWIVEMDLHGNIMNQECYGGNGDDLGWDIIKLPDGYAFCASTNSNDVDVSGLHGPPGEPMYDDIWAVKTSLDGTIIWQKCLGGYSSESPVYITATADSGYIIIGNTNSHDGDVSGNHTTEWNELDIWVVKLSSDGQLVWEHSFGGLGTDRFYGIHSVLKKDDYNFVIGANSNYAGDDVICDVIPDYISEAWLFEIKDCNYYAPGIPVIHSGPDTLCSTDSTNAIYRIDPATRAWDYEWELIPAEAGTMLPDSLSVQITWNPIFEGSVEIKSRSYNDCGYSAWSEAFITQVYTCLGTGEYNINANSLIINPNPANDKVTISVKGKIRKEQIEISFLNILGNEIKRGLLSEGEESTVIDISELPAGIYFVAIIDEGKRITSGKMVVAR